MALQGSRSADRRRSRSVHDLQIVLRGMHLILGSIHTCTRPRRDMVGLLRVPTQGSRFLRRWVLRWASSTRGDGPDLGPDPGRALALGRTRAPASTSTSTRIITLTVMRIVLVRGSTDMDMDTGTDMVVCRPSGRCTWLSPAQVRVWGCTTYILGVGLGMRPLPRLRSDMVGVPRRR